MRLFYWLLLVCLLPVAVYAQQPFERFGVKVKVLTLSNGKYPEFFGYDSLRRVGSVVYDTKRKRIAYLLPPDSLAGRAKAEVTSRWLAVDPLADKYVFISPYVYVADNPVNLIDPDGRKIVAPNKAQREQIAKLINERAAGKFAFNSKGQLYLKERKLGEAGSDYYTSRLIAAIKDKDKVSISIAETVKIGGKSENVDKDHGGGVTKSYDLITPEKDPKTEKTTATTEKVSEVTISGNENKTLQDTHGEPLRDTASDILAHELIGHAIPYTTGKDTGNAVENENKVRFQQPSDQNARRRGSGSHTE